MWLWFWKFLNGVCRHEQSSCWTNHTWKFLNGVCRHEQANRAWYARIPFLNGVCRHEQPSVSTSFATSNLGSCFLNGVCRHEHLNGFVVELKDFLNGVCRHEPWIAPLFVISIFLNGVCRHELTSPSNSISKSGAFPTWRAVPATPASSWRHTPFRKLLQPNLI